MDKMQKLRKFLLDNGYKGKQTFNCRNIAGDSMTNVYDEDGIQVDFCYYYDYLEIFGLTFDEYYSLRDILEVC